MSAESGDRGHHFVLFLPFLRLNESCTVAGVEFIPLRDRDGNVPGVLQSAAGALESILSGYVDRRGDPLNNCVVATVPGRGWDLERNDFATAAWATSLLFLATWALNEYFPRFGGAYVNSSNFRLVGQAYGGDAPRFIAVSSRRRDGSTTDGGYKHGEFKFSLPLQVSLREAASVDVGLLAALDAAHAAGSVTVERLRTAFPFVELANTDDEFMTEHAEAILMGSAFEQLLAGDASAYRLGAKFGELFGQFAGVTVEEAKRVRSGIEIDESTPERAAAQPKWWVHRKWIEELYDVRSKVVHRGHPGDRSWGWQVGEHLVMAAHVFPLAVKLLLEQEGHYAPTDEDRASCLATDLLLSETRWVATDDGREEGRSWNEVIQKTRRDLRFDAIWERYKAKHPDLFQPDSDEPVEGA